MDDQTLSILSGIAQGAEKASQNLFNIGIMKYELKQKNEAFQLDKKVKNAQLDALEFEHGPEAVGHLRKKMDLESKQFKVTNELYDLLLSTETQKNKGELRSWQDKLQGLGISAIGDLKFNQPEESYRNDLRLVQSGKATWEALQEKYPDKVENINKLKQETEDKEVLAKSPIQHVGMVDVRRTQPGFANMNPATRAISQQIKTKGDLRKLMDKANTLQAAGVNVQALMDYYKDEIAGM